MILYNSLLNELNVLKNLRIELFLFLLAVLALLSPISFDFYIYSYFYDFIHIDTRSVVVYENQNYHFVEKKDVLGPVGFFPIIIEVDTNRVILKNFFEQITNLGSSVWYFIIIVFLFVLSLILKIFKIGKLFIRKQILSTAKFALFYLLLTGLLTQIIKIILGRARPNYTNFQNNFNLEFFTIDPHFHSFPSGHSSTVFCIVIILGVLFPKIKYFFYISGLFVSISRVLVGAHFFTDVFAGMILAIISYKLLILIQIFFKKFNLGKIEKIKFSKNEVFYNSFILFLFLGVYVSVSPLIDIIISSFFYLDENQFYLQKSNYITIFFRKFYLPFLLFYILFLTIFSRFFNIKILFFNNIFYFKDIVFIWISSIISILLVVNFFLKDLWGRSRPNDIIFFDGDFLFTPWFSPSTFCDSNCSFVSGDASVGFLTIVLFFLTRNIWFFHISLFSGCALGLVRIAEGGHFFSDIIFAHIFVTISLALSLIVYNKIYDK